MINTKQSLIELRNTYQKKLDAVNEILNDFDTAPAPKGKRAKRKVSAAVKAKMSEAAKARWAKRKAAK